MIVIVATSPFVLQQKEKGMQKKEGKKITFTINISTCLECGDVVEVKSKH
jgi:hypothetical protein